MSHKNPKKQIAKKISGNWVIPNISDHFSRCMSAAMIKKKALKKANTYKKNKGKKLSYVLKSTGKFINAKKSDKGKNIINVQYN